MADDYFPVAVVLARRELEGPWGGVEWLPRAVLPSVPAAAPGTSLACEGKLDISYGGCCEVALHSAETAHYRDNLASGRPSLWVALETTGEGDCRIASITADPYEGEALAGAMDLIVEPVAMPAEIIEKVAAFVTAFHVERPFVKLRRDALAPGGASQQHGGVLPDGGNT